MVKVYQMKIQILNKMNKTSIYEVKKQRNIEKIRNTEVKARKKINCCDDYKHSAK